VSKQLRSTRPGDRRLSQTEQRLEHRKLTLAGRGLAGSKPRAVGSPQLVVELTRGRFQSTPRSIGCGPASVDLNTALSAHTGTGASDGAQRRGESGVQR